MTRSLYFAALAAIVLSTGLAVRDASAQPPSYAANPQVSAGQIALIDVDFIFRTHKRYRDMVKAVQESEKAVGQSFMEEKKAIQNMMAGLRDLDPGSLDYRQLDEKIARRKSDLQAQAELKQKEFEIYKVKMLHTIHSEIRQEVVSVVTGRGFTLVMKFGVGEKADPSKPLSPDQMVREIGSMVMYSAPGVDITGEVLARLDRRASYSESNGTAQRTGGIPGRG